MGRSSDNRRYRRRSAAVMHACRKDTVVAVDTDDTERAQRLSCTLAGRTQTAPSRPAANASAKICTQSGFSACFGASELARRTFLRFSGFTLTPEALDLGLELSLSRIDRSQNLETLSLTLSQTSDSGDDHTFVRPAAPHGSQGSK